MSDTTEVTTAAASPEMRGLAVLASALVSRASLADRAGLLFDGARDLRKVLGYRGDLQFNDYFAKYERQDIAGRIVDMPAREVWKEPPWVSDTEDDDAETAFVKAWTQLVKDRKVWHYIERADRLAGIGRYSVLLIGIRDNLKLEQPAEKMKGPEDVLFLSPFGENHAKIAEWETDTQNPRFGQPRIYDLTLSSGVDGFKLSNTTGDTVRVHHSRLLHIADDLLSDEVYGRPRLKRVFDRLDDLAKISGGSAEIFWQVAAQLLHVNIDKDVQVGKDDLKLLDEQLQEVMHNLRRTLQTQGATVQGIGGGNGGGRGVDPTGVFNVLRQLIASAAEIPMRILFGNEAGDLSSTQDEDAWNGRIVARRTRFAEPMMLRPLIDRLILLNGLPAPEGGEYEVKWPEVGEPGMAERAEVADKIADAANKLAAGGGTQVVPIHEFREELLGLSPVPPPPPAGMPEFTPPAPPPEPPPGPVDNIRRLAGNAPPEWKLIRHVADRIEPQIRSAFLEAVKNLRGKIDLSQLEAALSTTDLTAAEVETLISELAAEWQAEAQAALQHGVQGGGDVAAAALGGQLGLTLSFDLTNPAAVAWIEQHAAEMVTQVGEESRLAVRTIVQEMFEQGITPKVAARRIVQHVGLNQQQAQAVVKYRASLEASGVTGEALEAKVAKYAAAKLRERGDTIARHEAISAANQGQRELWRQAAAEGYIRLDPEAKFATDLGASGGPPLHVLCRCALVLEFGEDGTARMVWVVTPDDRLCPYCAPLAGQVAV